MISNILDDVRRTFHTVADAIGADAPDDASLSSGAQCSGASEPGDEYEQAVEAFGARQEDAIRGLAFLSSGRSSLFSRFTEEVLAAMRARCGDPAMAHSFARDAACRSSNPRITGNYEGHPKCNLFAGDILSAAGFQVPTYKMKGGGEHYKEAEQWPKETAFFNKVTDLRDVRPGDVLIVDWANRAGSGGGAHVELVTGVDHEGNGRLAGLTSMGARRLGLEENDRYGAKFLCSTDRGDGWHCPANGLGKGEALLYILRPKLMATTIAQDIQLQPSIRG